MEEEEGGSTPDSPVNEDLGLRLRRCDSLFILRSWERDICFTYTIEILQLLTKFTCTTKPMIWQLLVYEKIVERVTLTNWWDTYKRMKHLQGQGMKHLRRVKRYDTYKWMRHLKGDDTLTKGWNTYKWMSRYWKLLAKTLLTSCSTKYCSWHRFLHLFHLLYWTLVTTKGI